MFVWFDCWGRESTSGRGQMHFEFVVRETQNGKYLTSVCILFWINTIFSEIHIIQITDNTFVQTWLEFANFGISLHSPMWCVLFCKILRLTWNFSLGFVICIGFGGLWVGEPDYIPPPMDCSQFHKSLIASNQSQWWFPPKPFRFDPVQTIWSKWETKYQNANCLRRTLEKCWLIETVNCETAAKLERGWHLADCQLFSEFATFEPVLLRCQFHR